MSSKNELKIDDDDESWNKIEDQKHKSSLCESEKRQKQNQAELKWLLKRKHRYLPRKKSFSSRTSIVMYQLAQICCFTVPPQSFHLCQFVSKILCKIYPHHHLKNKTLKSQPCFTSSET